jgi:CRP/FNR family cyclic AMP-dependent transcriptional regulator
VKQDIIEKLKLVSIFASLKDDEVALKSIADMIEKKNISSGQTIIKEGDEGEEMFILFKGSVEVRKNTLAKDPYTVTKLTAEQNAFFGELALIDNDKRSASIVASTDCELLVMRKEKFLQLGDKNSHIGLSVTRNISHILGQRLRRANQDLATLYEALVGQIEEST